MNFTFSNKSHGSNHRLARPKNSFFHKIGRDFVSDWLTMLAISSFIIIIYIGIGYVKYNSSTSTIDSPSGVMPPVSSVRFSSQRLDALLGKYDAKQKLRANFISGQYSITDPGL